MKNYEWYQQLNKPSWAPSPKVFGPVWIVLYILIALSYGSVAALFARHEIPFLVLLPFILNIIFNLSYTPLQFELKNIPLATLDIILVLGTLIWALVVIHPFALWVSYINIPYLLWVCFATCLQIAILKKN